MDWSRWVSAHRVNSKHDPSWNLSFPNQHLLKNINKVYPANQRLNNNDLNLANIKTKDLAQHIANWNYRAIKKGTLTSHYLLVSGNFMTTSQTTMKQKILIGTLPVFLGGLIYLTYRADTLLMFSWAKYIGLTDFVNFLRTDNFLQNLTIPNWVKYSLPDALWLFSFTYIILLLWDFKINRQSVLWIFLTPTVGLFSELGQLVEIIPGTFDKIDLLLLLLAAIFPLTFVSNSKSINIKIIWQQKKSLYTFFR